MESQNRNVLNIQTGQFSQQLINQRTDQLYNKLILALNSDSLTYSDICKINHQGLYIIFDDLEILYVGKTNRTGKIRIRELASDFRSHTFNKKLLSRRFRDLGLVFEVLKNETKEQWILTGIMSENIFKSHQKDVNSYIKQHLKFKFHQEQDARLLISFEHYAIAILNPMHND